MLDACLEEAVRRDNVRVPPYPATALRLQQLLAKPDFSLDAVVDAMRADQVFTGNLLRLANSSFYRRAQEVMSVSAAVLRIGANELTRLAMASAVGQLAPVGRFDGVRRRVWRQALASALLTEALAAKTGHDPGDAFVTGLMHDAGKLLGIAALEQAGVGDDDTHVWEALERQHVKLGLVLCKRWQLPIELERVVANHHVDGPEDDVVLRHVQLADMLVGILEEQPSVGVEDVQRVVRLSKPVAEALAELMPKIPALVEAFDLPARPAPPPQAARLAVAPPALVRPAAPAAPAASPAPAASAAPAVCAAPAAEAPPVPPKRSHLVDVKGGGLALTRVPVRQATSARMSFDSERRVTTNTLVEVVLRAEVETRFWAVVEQCAPDGERFVVEVKPFALSTEAAKAWSRLAA